MHRRYALIYFTIAGWAGVLMAGVMMLCIMTVDPIHQSACFIPFCLVGAAASLLSGIVILAIKKDIPVKVDVFFVVIGICALLFVLVRHIDYENTLGTVERVTSPSTDDN